MPPKKKATKSKPKPPAISSDDEQAENSSTSATPSASKRIKTDQETFPEFMNRISNQRPESVLHARFNKSRCRTLSDCEERMPVSHSGILYWMSRDQRVQDNWALLYAQRLALKEKVPLFVCFNLVPKFLQATLRQYAFMLRGLQAVREELHGLKIPFHLLTGEPKITVTEFAKKYKIGGVVTDFSPLRVPMQWADEVAQKLSAENIPLCQVDAHNIVPVWVASDKLEYAARTIRPRIDRQLTTYLTEFPRVISHSLNSNVEISTLPNPFEEWDNLIATLEIDKTIKEVEWAKPGTEEGLKTLKSFLDNRIKVFHSKRNDPNENALSNLSPWFHFGQISVARAIIEAKKSPHKEGVAAFVEEAVIRRELSDNFCFYNNANYDSIEGAYDWAKKTLNDHKKDKRTHIYSRNQFETAKTHDLLWNAAQNQLRIEAKMHGFLRMYWAKKILEWSESPEKALEIAIYLNDKYNLDGRDPNGYVGCMWSICGIHDQGWREREVFGKIRFMNYDGCKRKFDVAAFEEKYKKMA